MLSKSLLTSALVGLAAQATSAMLITPLIVESSHEVLLECAECTSVMKEPNVALQNLQIPSLALNFSVSHTTLPSALSLNDVPIFPWASVSPDAVIQASIVTSPSSVDQAKEEVPISFQILVQDISSNHRMILDSFHIAKMTMTITRVGGIDIGKSLAPIELTLLQMKDGAALGNGGVIRIIRVTTTGLTALPDTASPSDREKAGEAKECSRLPQLCRIKAAAAAKLAKLKSHFKGCAGHRHAGKAAAGGHRHQSNQAAHQGQRPHHHGHGHRHGHAHRAKHVIKTILLHVILPILVGVAAGMTASLVGMIIGSLIVSLWRRFYCGDDRGVYDLVGSWDPRFGVEEVIVVEDEGQEAPPAYADEKAPIEAVVVVTEDQK